MKWLFALLIVLMASGQGFGQDVKDPLAADSTDTASLLQQVEEEQMHKFPDGAISSLNVNVYTFTDDRGDVARDDAGYNKDEFMPMLYSNIRAVIAGWWRDCEYAYRETDGLETGALGLYAYVISEDSVDYWIIWKGPTDLAILENRLTALLEEWKSTIVSSVRPDRIRRVSVLGGGTVINGTSSLLSAGMFIPKNIDARFHHISSAAVFSGVYNEDVFQLTGGLFWRSPFQPPKWATVYPGFQTGWGLVEGVDTLFPSSRQGFIAFPGPALFCDIEVFYLSGSANYVIFPEKTDRYDWRFSLSAGLKIKLPFIIQSKND